MSWLKLHRQIQDNELYFLESFTKMGAWIDLLITAAFRDGHILVRGNIIEIKRGQNGYSEDTLAKRRQWSRGKVRRYLNYLETIQQIIQQKSKVKSIITIVNYDKYQGDDTTDDTTDRHQTIQQTDTIKKYNKEKNVKEITYTDEFEKFYQSYPIHKGKKEGQVAFTNALKITNAETLVKGAIAYSNEIRRTGQEKIKRCQGWLNDRRREDEYENDTEPQIEDRKHYEWYKKNIVGTEFKDIDYSIKKYADINYRRFLIHERGIDRTKATELFEKARGEYFEF